MVSSKEISGIWTAIATPFTLDGSIDWHSYEKMIQFQVESGIKGLVIAGTTGESSTLGIQEKLSLIKKTFALVKDHNVRLMVGSGGSNTEQSIEFSGLALQAGADSLLVVTPPYNKPNVSGLYKHFEAIAKAHKSPICLYHVPGRTAQKLSISDFKFICEIPEIVAIKEASADINLFSSVVQECSKQVVLSGDDPTFLPSLAVGGKGSISVLSNIFPKELLTLQKSFEDGRYEEALKIHNNLFAMMNTLFCETNPCPVKASLSLLGLCENTLRLPLAPVSEENFVLIRDVLFRTKHKFEKV